MARAFDSVKTEKFLQRNVYSEVINYRGNVSDIHGITNYPQMFYALDVDQVMNEDFVSELTQGQDCHHGFPWRENGYNVLGR